MPEFATRQDITEMRQDLRIHTEDDKAFQDRIFAYMGKRFDRLDIMWDETNRRKGAEESAAKNEVKGEKSQGKVYKFGEWAVNTCITIAIAVATIKAMK